MNVLRVVNGDYLDNGPGESRFALAERAPSQPGPLIARTSEVDDQRALLERRIEAAGKMTDFLADQLYTPLVPDQPAQQIAANQDSLARHAGQEWELFRDLQALDAASRLVVENAIDGEGQYPVRIAA